MHLFKMGLQMMGRDLRRFKKFGRAEKGEMALNMAIYFSIFAIGAALLLPTLLEKNISLFATNGQGVDRVVVGSVKAKKSRYRIIRSVISPEVKQVCLNLKSVSCLH